jgi:hypothetical protein
MSDVNFIFSTDDLATAIIQKLLPILKDFKPQDTPQVEKYLTRKETAGKLNVSLPTLNEYTKRQYITGYRFGVRVLYKQSEIETCLKKIPNQVINEKMKEVTNNG